MSYSYGQQAAMKRAKKRVESKPASTSGQRRRSATRQVANPTKYEPWPLREARYNPKQDRIDWEDHCMLAAAHELALRIIKNNPVASILKLPTGVGKTAIAVCALGEVQKIRGEKVRFLVTAKVKIIKEGGWQETILSYNAHHGDNTLDPFIMQPYDSFANILSHPQTLAEVKEELGDEGIVVADEIHNFKTAVGRRAKQLHKLRGRYILGLSATPNTNNPVQDGVSYLIMAGYYKSYNDFLTQHRLKDQVDKYGNLKVYGDEGYVSRALFPGYGRFLRELASVIYAPDIDTSDLNFPELVEHIRQLPASETLEAEIESIRKAYRDKMFDTVTDMRMSLVDRISSDKDRLDELVKIAKGNVHQLLIFYQFKSALHAMTERFKAEGISYQVIEGKTRLEDIDLLRPDPIFVQYQAGSEGLDKLRESTGTVFYENQGSYLKQQQARGRNLRRDRGGRTDHWYLIAPVAFDMELYDNLRRRGELNEALLDELALASIGI